MCQFIIWSACVNVCLGIRHWQLFETQSWNKLLWFCFANQSIIPHSQFYLFLSLFFIFWLQIFSTIPLFCAEHITSQNFYSSSFSLLIFSFLKKSPFWLFFQSRYIYIYRYRFLSFNFSIIKIQNWILLAKIIEPTKLILSKTKVSKFLFDTHPFWVLHRKTILFHPDYFIIVIFFFLYKMPKSPTS